MDFKQVRDEVKCLKIDALRTDCDNYFEAVIIKEELAKLTNRLENFFGIPAWPSKGRLPLHVRQVINSFGGVMAGQTLYLHSEGKETTFAMLWPWQDGERTTLKIVQK